MTLGSFRPVEPGPTDTELGELREIVRQRSFRFGRYTLSSGAESDIYFNMKPTMMVARGAHLAAAELLAIALQTKADYVGGLEMGAVPVIGSLASLSSVQGTPVNTIFVRKQPKAHGTKDVIEGLGPNDDLTGKVVLVIDDVATSGKSILKALEAVRAAGGIVRDAACLVDRDEGATAMLAEHGVTLHSVLHASDFVERV